MNRWMDGRIQMNRWGHKLTDQSRPKVLVCVCVCFLSTAEAEQIELALQEIVGGTELLSLSNKVSNFGRMSTGSGRHWVTRAARRFICGEFWCQVFNPFFSYISFFQIDIFYQQKMC